MNAPIIQDRLNLRAADLKDIQECARLDAWILGRKDATPFHRPQWLKAVESATGQKAHCLIVEARDSAIVGILPLHIISSPIFGRAAVSSGFAVGGGILADTRDAIAMLSVAGWQLAVENKCPSLELRGGALPDPDTNTDWELQQGAHANFARALCADEEAELLAIPRKQRAEIRKGLGNDLEIKTGSSTQDLAWHYAVYSQSVHNLGTPVFPRALMIETLKAFGEDTDILTVIKDGRPVASVLSLYHLGTVMPYWGGGVWDARSLRANDVMYYALMNHARGRGCHSFDFGRSKTGSGAYAFKKNWGFEPDPLSYAVRTADGQAPRDVNPASGKYKAQIAMWQKLPLPIANFIGPWLAKGLG